MLRAIFDVSYRHCTIPGGNMRNLKNDKYDDGGGDITALINLNNELYMPALTPIAENMTRHL
jgi:hypothetical protein